MTVLKFLNIPLCGFMPPPKLLGNFQLVALSSVRRNLNPCGEALCCHSYLKMGGGEGERGKGKLLQV